jgi:HK97 family phage portal protein
MSIFTYNKDIRALRTQVDELAKEKRDIWTTMPVGPLGIPYTSSFDIKKNLTLSAVYAATNKISNDIATLDLKLYKKDAKGFKKEFTDSPLYDLLLYQPNPSMNSFMFWKIGMLNMLNNGNMYVYIVRDKDFTPVALHLLPPNAVSKVIVNGQRKWNVQGLNNLYNTLPVLHGVESLVDDSNMIHIINFPDPDDSDLGISNIRYARSSFETLWITENQSSEFLKNGSNSNAYIQAEGSPTPKQVEDIQNRWRNAYNQLLGTKQIPVMPLGMTVHQLSISPKDAQLLESRQWNITEVARWYSIHPSLLFDNVKQLAGTVEAIQIEYLHTTLQPQLQKIINEFAVKLILPKDRKTLSLDFDLTDLISMDSSVQAKYYIDMTSNGYFTINDVRKKIGQPWVEGGDEVRVTVQTQSITNTATVNTLDNNLKKDNMPMSGGTAMGGNMPQQ